MCQIIEGLGLGRLAHGAYRPVVSGFAKELCIQAAAEKGDHEGTSLERTI